MINILNSYQLSDEVEKMRLELTSKDMDQERVESEMTKDLVSTQELLAQVRSQLTLAEKVNIFLYNYFLIIHMSLI